MLRSLALASTVLQALGYETETKLLSVPVTYTALSTDDVDIYLGNWMPTMEADIAPGSTVVCLISGGYNDVSRYGEILERSLVHLGLKHYFLVDFPQEPGALRRFLDTILGPNDDITLIEYVKRNNRETGPALVGIELGSAADLEPLLARMAAAPPTIEQIPPDSPLFRFLL